jgi:hypothetical protein
MKPSASPLMRLKTILAGIAAGLLALGALSAVGWYILLGDDGPQMLNRKWYISGIEHLRGEFPPGDVWQFPYTHLLEPTSIQRAEWSETTPLARAPWGYLLYYKARVKDPQLSQHLRTIAEHNLRPLPPWAAHTPQWWNPQQSIPTNSIPQLPLHSDHLFITTTDGDVFLYWLVSHEGQL